MTDSGFQPQRGAAFCLPFAPDFAAARIATTQLRGFLAAHGIPRADLFACELCAAEACNNAVEYAPATAKQLHPILEALVTPGRIELRVTDHTLGFELPPRSSLTLSPTERGRGVFLIQSLMDEVSYLRGTGENLLVMRKHRRAPSSEAPPQHSPEDIQRELFECKRTVAGMARELCFRSETLSAVFRCCAELGGSGDPEGFEERLLNDLLHLTSADWYVLRLINPSDGRLVAAAVSEPSLKGPPLEPERTGLTGSLEARVAASRKPGRFEARTALPDEPLLAAGRQAHGIVYPLYFANTLVGTVAVGRTKGGWFGELQDEVVRTFAEFLAIQTVNLRRRQQEVESKVLARELEIARDIQRSLLPVSLPQVPGFGLAGGWRSAREVGGDFYDAIAIDPHTLLLIVADVMGKGVPAALFATIIRGLVRGLSAHGEGPARLLGRLNRLLYAELSSVSMFITAQIVSVDLARRRVVAASAGHCPLLYVPPEGGDPVALPTRGIPLGVLPETTYRNQTAFLGKPATLLLHTDGLTEVRGATGEMYGQKRLMQWLASHRGSRRPAGELRDCLDHDLERFRGGAPLTDDQAFLILTEDPVATEASSRWSKPEPAEREPLGAGAPALAVPALHPL